jgi:hypothetical protein
MEDDSVSGASVDVAENQQAGLDEPPNQRWIQQLCWNEGWRRQCWRVHAAWSGSAIAIVDASQTEHIAPRLARSAQDAGVDGARQVELEETFYAGDGSIGERDLIWK